MKDESLELLYTYSKLLDDADDAINECADAFIVSIWVGILFDCGWAQYVDFCSVLTFNEYQGEHYQLYYLITQILKKKLLII